jgi:ketosteroid isomerase-like protein
MDLQTAIYPFCMAILAFAAAPALASPEDDRKTIAALDVAYQAAVERNDAEAMGKILHEDMILVVGDGRVRTGEQLMEMARTKEIVWEHQVEEPGTQIVRLYGRDTAVVTALLWLKGVRRGQPLDRWLWFSDTYVRTAQGWKYVFGQAAADVPPPDPSKLR